jgi:hypothetical protein
MTATTLAAPIFLGERREEAVWAPVAEEVGEAFDRTAIGSSLTEVAAQLEAGLVRLREEDLPQALRTRVALRTLHRRAEKRGFGPVLRCTTANFRSIAKSAGWQTELMKVPSPSARPGTLPRARPSALPPADAGAHSPAPGPLATCEAPRAP